jgi:outer membrane protein assembly factor BamB
MMNSLTVFIPAQFVMLVVWVLFGLAFSCSSLKPKESRWALRSAWVSTPTHKAQHIPRKFHKIKPVLAVEESSGREFILYTTPAHGVIAVDRLSGEKVWQYSGKFGAEVGVSVVGDMVFYPSTDGNIYALQLATGQLLWSFPTRSENVSPLTVTKGVVFAVTNQNVVYALEALTGRLMWLYARGDSVFFSVRGQAPAVVLGERVFAAFSDGSVVALDWKSGKLLWEQVLVKKSRFLDLDWIMQLDGSRLLVGAVEDQLYELNPQTGLVEAIYPYSSYYAPEEKGHQLLLTTYPKNIVSGIVTSPQMIEWKKIGYDFSSLPSPGVLLEDLLVVGETQGPLNILGRNATNPNLAQYYPGRGVMGPILVLPGVRSDKKDWELYFVSGEYYLHKLTLQQER